MTHNPSHRQFAMQIFQILWNALVSLICVLYMYVHIFKIDFCFSKRLNNSLITRLKALITISTYIIHVLLKNKKEI